MWLILDVLRYLLWVLRKWMLWPSYFATIICIVTLVGACGLKAINKILDVTTWLWIARIYAFILVRRGHPDFEHRCHVAGIFISRSCCCYIYNVIFEFPTFYIHISLGLPIYPGPVLHDIESETPDTSRSIITRYSVWDSRYITVQYCTI